MRVQVRVLTKDFGEFIGFISKEISFDEYISLIEDSKNFYKGGFEMELIDGSFIIIPPEVISGSILIIKIIDENYEV